MANVTSSGDSSNPTPVEGIVAREERAAAEAIRAALRDSGIDIGNRPIDLRSLPFEGTWGSASTISRMVAGELVTGELEAEGKLEGLSKKEAKKLVNASVGERAQEIATTIADHLRATGRFGSIEAANGYINVSYDANTMASSLVREVVASDETYGHAAPDSRSLKVMIEHSQLNTHKAAHVGHLRNICFGVAVTNISEAAGFTTIPVTYIGDIGRHVIRCLWCYDTFHKGEEPEGTASRGRWLGELYAEAVIRLDFRKNAAGFLDKVIKEDDVFVEAADKMLKSLWRQNVEGEDIAYILGRFISREPFDVGMLNDDSVMVPFWPIVGEQLRDEIEKYQYEGAVDLLAEWEQFNSHMADWWPNVPSWIEQERETFQLWEKKDPAFVALWEQTRSWSVDELKEIFDEFDAHFDVWFWESEVEDAGRQIVRELLERGIAEVSEGLPVVKIDEKLGLEKDTYHTMPILRSDGTTLYSTKDLALTQQKFEQYGVDQTIWVVDVRQSLYFDQITKILELYGFAQAENSLHLSYEFVTLPSGIMSSRRGNAPMLEDVRKTMLDRALAVIQEKNPDIPEAEQQRIAHDVAIGAIKYVMLARDGNKVITFDPEEALSFDGHASPYIQYAHARACRILEHAGITDADVLASLDATDFGHLAPEELTLLQKIAELPGMVQRAADEHRPLHLTNYVFELAKCFNDFYHACPVLQSEEPVRSARLGLVITTRTTLRNGLALLGIAAPTQM